MRPWKREVKSGYALVFVIVFIMVIVMVVSATTASIRQTLSSASHSERVLRARYAAAVGIRQAMKELSRDAHWSAPSSTLSGVVAHDASLGYTVDVYNNYGGVSPLPRPGGEVAPNSAWLRAVGTVDDVALSGGFGVLKTNLVKPEVTFPNAIHATDKLSSGRNIIIDSYSSQPYTAPAYPASQLIDADLRFDSGFTSSVDLRVDGDVILPDTPTPYEITGSSHITGQVRRDPVRPLPLRFRLPDALADLPPGPDAGAGPVAPGRYNMLQTSAGETVELAKGGSYYFEYVDLNPPSRIVLTDTPATADKPCIVYVGVYFNVHDHCEVNADLVGSRPEFLQVYFVEGEFFAPFGRSFEVHESSIFQGVVVGGAEVKAFLGFGAQLYGAVRTGKFNDAYVGAPPARVHYDRRLLGEELDAEPEWVLVGEGPGD